MNKISISIFLTIFASINLYLFIRGRQALPKNSIIQAAYSFVFLICSISFFIAAIFETTLSSVIIAICENIGGFWMIAFLYFLVAFLFADLLCVTDYFFDIFPHSIKANYSQAKLIYFEFVVFILVAFSVIDYIQFSKPQTVSLNLNIKKIATTAIIGRDDFTNKRWQSIKNIISNINKDLPMILLYHQPENLAEAVENNIDVQISGHTHNGPI